MNGNNFVLNHDVLNKLRNVEVEEFARRTPKSRSLFVRSRKVMPNGAPCSWMSALYPGTDIFAVLGEGCHIEDADGNRYLDMTQCDLSMVCGYGAPSIAQAVAERFANGSHFLLPIEDSIVASELLRERFSMPYWQFTLSASVANTEAIRICRFVTKRDKVLLFGGKYHGHIDETMVERTASGHSADHKGLPADVGQRTIEIDFNDLDALEAELKRGVVACVIAEPVMTNMGVIYPDPGFHKELRKLTRQYGALLIIDETHTQVAEYGGFTRLWGLEPDILTLGKCVGGGIPIGCYGLSSELAAVVEANTEPSVGNGQCLALGGTMFGNALHMTATRAALENIMTPDGYARLNLLGGKLADGIDAILKAHGLPWQTFRLGNRSGICLAEKLPRNAKEAALTINKTWNLAMRPYLANRGVWEPFYIHGPSVSFAHTAQDIGRYLDVLDEWIGTAVRAHA